MIFLTVGTQLPFDRLVKAIDIWCGIKQKEEVFGQIADPGAHGYKPTHFEWKSFVEPQEFKSKIEDAELIISHAGMGSIITALTLAKPIVILPRRASNNEHRNDHQLATAKKFQLRTGIYVAQDETDLPHILDNIISNLSNASKGKANQFANPSLINSVRDFILK